MTLRPAPAPVGWQRVEARPGPGGGGAAWASGAETAPVQARVDELQNKLATVICNAEVALDMVEGPARARLQAALRAAWTASALAAALPPQVGAPVAA